MKKDIILKCQNCGQNFVWTVGEQEFYNDKKFEEPNHCLICRGMIKKASEDDFRGKSGIGKKLE